MNLTPTELARLHTEGSVRVVRKCEPPINFGEYEGATDKQKSLALNQTAFLRNASPFPPSGTREVIDGIACVWGESGCRQQFVGLSDHEPEHPGHIYVWVGHIRKDTE